MKKTFLSVAVILLSLSVVFTACKKNAPKDVAQTWLTAFYHFDFETAKKESTEETKKMLSTLEQLVQMEPDSTKQQMKKIKIEIKDVKEEGDKATVTYTSSDSPNPETLHLVKQNGKWLVQFTKQDQMNDQGGDQPGPDQGAPNPSDTTGGGMDTSGKAQPDTVIAK
jgi:hypothetical protein